MSKSQGITPGVSAPAPLPAEPATSIVKRAAQPGAPAASSYGLDSLGGGLRVDPSLYAVGGLDQPLALTKPTELKLSLASGPLSAAGDGRSREAAASFESRALRSRFEAQFAGRDVRFGAVVDNAVMVKRLPGESDVALVRRHLQQFGDVSADEAAALLASICLVNGFAKDALPPEIVAMPRLADLDALHKKRLAVAEKLAFSEPPKRPINDATIRKLNGSLDDLQPAPAPGHAFEPGDSTLRDLVVVLYGDKVDVEDAMLMLTAINGMTTLDPADYERLWAPSLEQMQQLVAKAKTDDRLAKAKSDKLGAEVVKLARGETAAPVRVSFPLAGEFSRVHKEAVTLARLRANSAMSFGAGVSLAGQGFPLGLAYEYATSSHFWLTPKVDRPTVGEGDVGDALSDRETFLDHSAPQLSPAERADVLAKAEALDRVFAVLRERGAIDAQGKVAVMVQPGETEVAALLRTIDELDGVSADDRTVARAIIEFRLGPAPVAVEFAGPPAPITIALDQSALTADLLETAAEGRLDLLISVSVPRSRRGELAELSAAIGTYATEISLGTSASETSSGDESTFSVLLRAIKEQLDALPAAELTPAELHKLRAELRKTAVRLTALHRDAATVTHETKDEVRRVLVAELTRVLDGLRVRVETSDLGDLPMPQKKILSA